jgi:probable F420-dependent oxidoreductase
MGAEAIGTSAEEAGFESVWTVEHVLVPEGYESSYPYDPSGKMPGGEQVPIPDPLIWLSFVAAATSTLRLGTGILILPQRNAAVTAKSVATLDVLSGGRALLGIGVGWLREEFEALHVPFEGRGKHADDAIEVMRALWSDERANVANSAATLERAISLPKPIGGRVPIIVGGHSDAAARRAGRLGDGFFPGKGNHERLTELIAVMRRSATEAGRDPDQIEITAGSNDLLGDDAVGAVHRMEDLGVSRLIVPPLAFDAVGIRPALMGFGESVIDALR